MHQCLLIICYNSTKDCMLYHGHFFIQFFHLIFCLIALPSDSWAIKFHNNIIVIFETAAVEDDIVIKKNRILYIIFKFFRILTSAWLECYKSHNSSYVNSYNQLLLLYNQLILCRWSSWQVINGINTMSIFNYIICS